MGKKEKKKFKFPKIHFEIQMPGQHLESAEKKIDGETTLKSEDVYAPNESNDE